MLQKNKRFVISYIWKFTGEPKNMSVWAKNEATALSKFKKAFSHPNIDSELGDILQIEERVN